MERPWWEHDGLDLSTELWKRAGAIQQRAQARNAFDLTCEAIYRGVPLGSKRPTQAAPAVINIIRAKVSAIMSRMSRHRAFPVIDCEDAGWSERRFAKRVSSVLRSRMGQTKLEGDRMMVHQDTLVRGTGVRKVVRTANNDVTAERIPRCEILVSDRESQYGCPRSMFHLKSYPLEVARAMYPDKKDRDALESAASRATVEDRHYLMWGDDWADNSWQVPLLEGWHLPSSPTAGDGRRAVSCRGRTLSRDPWKRPRFPVAFLHWDPPMRGLFGYGLVESLAPVQQKMNDVHRDIQEALYYGGQLKVFVNRGSNINKEHLRARHPAVIEHDGAEPRYVAPLPVSQQMFSYLEWLLTIADDISGLARDFQSGNSQLAPDASGRAREVHDDIQSDRFAAFQLFDSLCAVDVGTLMVDEARSIAEECGTSAAPWIREHKWKKIDVDGGKYHLRLAAKNFLPDERAGKLSTVGDLGKAGLLSDPDELLDLFDEPDMQRLNRSKLGPRRAVARVMEDLCDPDVDLYSLTPDAFFPIDLGIKTALAELEDAWAGEAEPEVLDRFRGWIQLAEHEKKRSAAAAPVAPGMGAGPAGDMLPPAPPMPLLGPGDPMAATQPPPAPIVAAA